MLFHVWNWKLLLIDFHFNLKGVDTPTCKQKRTKRTKNSLSKHTLVKTPRATWWLKSSTNEQEELKLSVQRGQTQTFCVCDLQCLNASSILSSHGMSQEAAVTASDFSFLCPALLHQIDDGACIVHGGAAGHGAKGRGLLMGNGSTCNNPIWELPKSEAKTSGSPPGGRLQHCSVEVETRQPRILFSIKFCSKHFVRCERCFLFF